MPCWCCADISEFALERRYGPPPWAGCWGGPFAEPPTKAEHKDWLEARRKRLQERLADVDDELSKL
jgi:hypothetical protein